LPRVDVLADGLDAVPASVHARTRLAEEQLLFERTGGTPHLAVWRDPTWIQLMLPTLVHPTLESGLSTL
jgi:hypothetical protein